MGPSSGAWAIYMQVSTAQQKPDLQRDGLVGYAERARLQIVATYCDEAVSGRKEGRLICDNLPSRWTTLRFWCCTSAIKGE